jgi:hypothetical protein
MSVIYTIPTTSENVIESGVAVKSEWPLNGVSVGNPAPGKNMGLPNSGKGNTAAYFLTII